MEDFGFLFGTASEQATSSPESATGQPPAKGPDLGRGPIFEDAEEIQENKIGDFNSVAEVVGKAELISHEAVIDELDWRQRKNICILAKALYMQEQPITGQAIYALWPQGLNKSNKVIKEITDPAERGRVFRAGFRPTLEQIQRFLFTELYRESMGALGIEVDPDDTGLTAEQIGLITILANTADGKDLKRKLRDAGVTWAKYEVWLKQPAFRTFYQKRMTDSLKDAIPFAQQQIAAKMAAGDTAAIKFGMELTGFYNPNGQKQVDAQALIQIILDVIEEEVTDSTKLKAIANKITLRGTKAIGGNSSPVV